MTEFQERRAPDVQRVPYFNIVEVCSNSAKAVPFEAEALDLSRCGLHLRTAYLPEIGTELVCRFEDRGREVVAEGLVAWRREQGRVGEFGVKFSCLDSRSSEALRAVCEEHSASERPTTCAPALPSHQAGSRVKLHVAGLASPMKARVRSGTSRKVQVASSLEFLRVGRQLEIEDVELGHRRSAAIDAVSIALDPESQVPQLVVALRYQERDEISAGPAVLDSEEVPRPGARSAPPVPGSEPSLSELESQAFRSRSSVIALQAGQALKNAGTTLLSFGSSTGEKLNQGVQVAWRNLNAYRKRRAQTPHRRTTSPPPAGPVAVEGKRLRAQGPTAAPNGLPILARKKLGWGAACATVLVLALMTVAYPSAVLTPTGELGEAPALSAVTAASGAAGKSGEPLTPTRITANVPLFGPVPMTPVDPAANQSASGLQSVEAMERTAARASLISDNHPLDDDAPGAKNPSPGSPQSPTPWGQGSLTRPALYRLRLSAPGGALRGETHARGFSVLIPGRKVLEPAREITKRDSRLLLTRALNTPAGAKITFQFREAPPGYRVRLRNEYVEFMISAGDKPKPAKPLVAGSGRRQG